MPDYRKRRQHTSYSNVTSTWRLVDHPDMSGKVRPAGPTAGGLTRSERTAVTLQSPPANHCKNGVRCGHRGVTLRPSLATSLVIKDSVYEAKAKAKTFMTCPQVNVNVDL